MPGSFPTLCQHQYAEASYILLPQVLCLQLTKVTLAPHHIHVASSGRLYSTASQLMTSAETESCSHFNNRNI